MKNFILAILLIAVQRVQAQDIDLFTHKELHLWATGESGIITYYGTLNKRVISFTSNNTPSYKLTVQGQYKAFSLNIDYSLIRYGQNINNYSSSENFISKGNMIGLSFEYNPIRESKKAKQINLKIGGGLNYMAYRLSKDLFDVKGRLYNYWSDGTIRDLPETYENIFNSNRLTRDYSFETSDGKHSSLLISLSTGFDLYLTKNLKGNIKTAFYIPFSKELDNIQNRSKQSYLLFNSIGLSYYFAKAPRTPENPLYKSVDFKSIEIMDSDGDGVKDLQDECPETPKGQKVDKKGCLIDIDHDGIPDYLDKEPNTKKGLLVDTEGIGHEPSKETTIENNE
jgi:hypothetical protein